MIYTLNKKKLTYKNITLLTILSVVGISFLMGIAISMFVSSHTTTYVSEEVKTVILNERNSFSKKKLIIYIQELNLRFPKIVLAQAELESNYFKSKIFKENNNLFGMKVATSRPTTNKGEQYSHAVYDYWRESVQDYAFFQAAYLRNVKTEHQYFEYLRNNYAEDSSYVDKLKSIINKNK